ncbi:flavin monoamine oxidase family protein [Archangium sp.]|uniref:flavin monoamine oxidase family protein n=1 Tax=Archangium sp. TaxID=1872627 RepID=UPI002D34B366|nr:FAD-dependent oxidoreductase [Archangium sp.]HYO59384.1 FAD-dependent oxidoreductase [Archangium sp.]
MWDVAIVGGGLAGLAASHGLRGWRSLLLEEGERLGGRVLTRCQAGIHYDLGAVFGYDPRCVPFQFPRPALIREDEPIAIFHEGALHRGNSVVECLRRAVSERPARWREILAFLREERTASQLSPEAYALLNGFFRLIHAGELSDYGEDAQRDVLHRFHPAHYVDGNGSLVQAFAERIDASIRLRTRVLRVEEGADVVRLRVLKRGVERERTARYAIVATPARVTQHIVVTWTLADRRLLERVSYGAFTVVAIGLRGPFLEGLSYVATPSLPMNVLLKQHTRRPDVELLLAYYGERGTRRLRGKEDARIVQQVLRGLRTVDPGFSRDREPLFTDVQHWSIGGTVLSRECLGDWRGGLVQVSPRIFLAGDYLDVGYPYGMIAALHSGQRAAARVSEALGARRQRRGRS